MSQKDYRRHCYNAFVGGVVYISFFIVISGFNPKSNVDFWAIFIAFVFSSLSLALYAVSEMSYFLKDGWKNENYVCLVKCAEWIQKIYGIIFFLSFVFFIIAVFSLGFAYYPG